MWTLPQKVRDELGIGNDEILDDRQLENLIREAQEQVKEDLFTYHFDEEIDISRAGNSWNGTNTTFNTFSYPIMDSNYDNIVNGSDIKCHWIDNDYAIQEATITVSNATYGVVTITQSDGSTAIPSNADTIRVEYYSCHRNISLNHLENLTTILTANSVMNTFKAGTSISMADFQKNEKLLLLNPKIYLNKYYDLLRKLQGSSIKGV